jgi:excinuclease ABC subunit C
MQRNQLHKYNLPDVPGVYLFKQGRKVLYVGKATSLRDRVRSYFDDDLIATRGPRIVDMITRATGMIYHTTPTVLEALVLEAALIKKYQPRANIDGKDDKSFLYAVITKEEIPRVLTVRGKDLGKVQGSSGKGQGEKTLTPYTLGLTPDGTKIRAVYGPFPSGAQLKEGLRLIRRIFPFFDTPKSVGAKGKHQAAKIEFNTQIGQYPRDTRFTLASSIGQNKVNLKNYRKSIRKVALLLSGRGKELRRVLEREMREAAREERFENAAEARRELFALDHIQDVSLIKEQGDSSHRGVSLPPLRIEAYDTAHLSGTNAIGVMTVVVDGTPVKSEYRTFRIRGVKKNDDIASLREILSRRMNHQEWPFPKVIVVDGGKTQKNAAEKVLKELGSKIPVVAVVKDERHRPREVIGARSAGISEANAVLANAEAHRFSLSRHRRARSRNLHLK